jgi:hypothetical protein
MSAILGGVNASIRYSKWPVSSCPLMAGFGCPPRECRDANLKSPEGTPIHKRFRDSRISDR